MTNKENKATDSYTQAIDIVTSSGFTSEKARLIAIELANAHPEIFVSLARMVEKAITEAPESSCGKPLRIKLREKLAMAVGISDPRELGFDLLKAAKIILSENSGLYASSKSKVVAIHFIRSETGIGLVEAKSVVERIEARLAESPKLTGEIRDFFGKNGPITALVDLPTDNEASFQ